MHQIRDCTTGNGGHAAFASILWSPPLKVTKDIDHRSIGDDGSKTNQRETGGFQECLSYLQCDVLLVFGKDDPWCKPALAKKMLSSLDRRKQHSTSSSSLLSSLNITTVHHRYVEITNAGHCPNHEAPQAVGYIVKSWVNALNRSKDCLSFVGGNAMATTTTATVSTAELVSSSNQRRQPSLVFQEDWGETALTEREADDIKLGLIDRLATLIVQQ
jgi:hypothetical protein